MSDTAVKGFTEADTNIRTDSARRNRQIYNRMKYRLNKRRNLWLRSIASAKDPKKIKVLEAKIEALDFALAELEQV